MFQIDFARWRDDHAVTKVELLATLTDLKPISSAPPDDTAAPASRQDAWLAVADALTAETPDLAPLVHKMQATTVLRDGPAPQGLAMPVTLADGAGENIRIVLDYTGSMADFVAVAHEAGHALHHVASGAAAMPPAYREVCALLAEMTVACHLFRSGAAHAQSFEAARLADYNGYATTRLAGFLADIDADPNPAYDYGWNYPFAAAIAARVWLMKDRVSLTALFRSGARAGAVLRDWGVFTRINPANHMPPFHVDPADPARRAYQALGALAHLDIEPLSGPALTTIGDFYDATLPHLQEGCVLVGLDPLSRPLGYATWVQDGTEITLTRQAAPFGDHLQLQRKLETRLAAAGPVRAHHARSARKEQAAW